MLGFERFFVKNNNKIVKPKADKMTKNLENKEIIELTFGLFEKLL